MCMDQILKSLNQQYNLPFKSPVQEVILIYLKLKNYNYIYIYIYIYITIVSLHLKPKKITLHRFKFNIKFCYLIYFVL